jgi:hypothetical protein
MKQNCEVMCQLYKNFYALYNDNDSSIISCEMIAEKENIKFIFGIPSDHSETIEKVIASFYA